MAEETVVKDLLTHDMIVAGEELVRGLDASEYDVVGSLWFYLPESNEWRLMLVSPQLESEGPKKAYTRIQSVLSKEKIGVDLLQITVCSPNDTLIKLLRSAIKTGRKMSGVRFSRNRINNLFVEDAYIYRLL